MPPPTNAARSLGDQLFGLLAAGPYRRRWEREMGVRSSVAVSRAAVARVLAHHLVESGERSVYEEGIDRRLKDRVGRAAAGRISAETLRWFIAAFEMSEADAAALWARFGEGGRSPSPQGCRSVAVHELHHLGADGLPAWHRTYQVLRAEVDGVDRYRVRFDAETATVEVLRGGTAGEVSPAGGGLYGTEIRFGRPLGRGETVSLEYLTRFAWRCPPPRELRRACEGRVDGLELRVQWDPARLPARVRWAEWAGIDGPVASAEEVHLDSDRAVHRFVERVERRVVGFTWEWA